MVKPSLSDNMAASENTTSTQTDESYVTECSWQATQDGPQTFKVVGRTPPAGYVLHLSIVDNQLTERLTKPNIANSFFLLEDVRKFVNRIDAQEIAFPEIPEGSLVETSINAPVSPYHMLKYALDIQFLEIYLYSEEFRREEEDDEDGQSDEWFMSDRFDMGRRFIYSAMQLDMLIKGYMDAILDGMKDSGKDGIGEASGSNDEIKGEVQNARHLLQSGQDLRDDLAKLEEEFMAHFGVSGDMLDRFRALTGQFYGDAIEYDAEETTGAFSGLQVNDAECERETSAGEKEPSAGSL
ncbi:hypothetical protein ONS95_013521 [Cadophora gregata]|uniref:uncharacterized protein n=1 Tax=Cadophora gregata TaxID=51156 RepID=UPI0026DAB7C5|nr:uncharacterized protein ONS95_013521 [Cadophora gregata]KAK0116509.1 hypothetical protein ONS95_013521 [Cadophora gregata]